MLAAWLLAAACVAGASAERGSSLRGALEALQRRQRGHMRGPYVADYDVYEVLPPNAYPEPDYPMEIEEIETDPGTNYIVKLLEENGRPNEAYQYKLVKKKSTHLGPVDVNRKESAFRERTHHSDNERLRDLFADRNDIENEKESMQEKTENDAEYALLLSQLWSKYKKNKLQNNEVAPQGIVKLYKEKVVKKRYPDSWGPIAFKKKRSPDSETEHSVLGDFEGEDKPLPGPVNLDNYNGYDLTDDDKDELREEYAIAFQPLDDDGLSEMADDDQYAFDTIEKRFPVKKRSSGPYDWGKPKKRSTQNPDKHEISKRFRSSSGTDPKIIKDLSKIFGDSEPETVKMPVKRSSDHQSHDGKPPQLSSIPQNHTHERSNTTHHDDNSHEHHHNLHHPGISGKEVEHPHDHDHDHNKNINNEKPINIKKKSIDWSNYFGIDKRKKKSVSFVNDLNEDRLRKQYFDTFNKEVIYPVNSFRRHSNVKRNYVQPRDNEETEIQIDTARAIEIQNDDKKTNSRDSKLDNIDQKLKNMEGLIVDEALQYSNAGEELDSKEEQEMKEKLLSRLAAAYSLEKMRKALKDFKQSLQTQKPDIPMQSSPIPMEEAKAKRVAVKKEKVEIINNEIPVYNKGEDKEDDFEEEQGAGHYLNGKNENQYSEGYMGGSGRHRTPVMSTGGAAGACPVLAKIVQRCRGVDLLAGDRGQLFLPLCSLHQICYLCGDAPPTTCDLVFLSEADTACEGDMGCQRAARSALMALRELHDSLADELDGECEASPCLPATLKLNIGWQRALQR